MVQGTAAHDAEQRNQTINMTPSIKIEGIAGSGKSALAWAIKAALSTHGITCAIGGGEDEKEGVLDESWERRLSHLKGKTVTITTIQSKRE
jgi:adenylylsulfate kinase-like enzyme